MARRRVEDVPFPVAEDWKRNERVMICLESSHIASQCSSTTVEECAFGCVFMATIGLLERKTTAATTTYVDPKTLLIGSRFPVTSQLRRTIKCRGRLCHRDSGTIVRSVSFYWWCIVFALFIKFATPS